MNDAHLHMVVNHFPIIGTIFGVGILIAGLVLKNNSARNIAYFLFIISAIFAAISMNTGEGAEEIAEKLPGVTEQIIEIHEEIAEKFSLIMYFLGSFSLISLLLAVFKKHQEKYVGYFTLLVAIIALYFAQQTGTTGGEIRHTEIRENTTFQNDVISVDKEIKSDDD